MFNFAKNQESLLPESTPKRKAQKKPDFIFVEGVYADKLIEACGGNASSAAKKIGMSDGALSPSVRARRGGMVTQVVDMACRCAWELEFAPAPEKLRRAVVTIESGLMDELKKEVSAAGGKFFEIE